MAAEDHLGQQFMPVSELIKGTEPEIDTMMSHRDQVDKLADSMREHGYCPEMADHPIQVYKGAVVEGQHRVWAAHYAGISHLPVEAD
jgi:ParB-like chromosome segregation protein Spo0J